MYINTNRYHYTSQEKYKETLDQPTGNNAHLINSIVFQFESFIDIKIAHLRRLRRKRSPYCYRPLLNLLLE